MASTVRVRLYWDNGDVEQARVPIDKDVRMIIRLAADGTRHHFEITDDVDADGFVIAREVPVAS